MKMRGYSVLLVCALCVFVLCGAVAAAVAQDKMFKKAAEEAKGRADAAKVKGEEALDIQKVFASDVSSVMSDLTLAIRKIDASKTPAGEIMQEIGRWNGEQILEQINALKKKAGDAEAAVKALKDNEAETLKDEQTKTALTDIMEEVENNMKELEEKAAAAVTDDITFIGAAIENAAALETAAKEASGLWHNAKEELEGQRDKTVDAITAVTTTITAMEGFLIFFDGSSDLGAQEVNKELSYALENMLKPSLVRLMRLRDESNNAVEAAIQAGDEYNEVNIMATRFKRTAEDWKKKTEAAKAMADAAKVKGDKVLGIDKEFTSNVSSVMSNLTSAIRKIDALKTQAGEIKEEIEGRNGEQILEQINGLVKDAEAVVNALKDAEAETLRDEQTKTALTDIMGKVELNMTDVEKAVAAVANDITVIGAVIEKVGALKTAAVKASDLWHVVKMNFDKQLDKAEDAITAVTTTITAMEIAAESFGKSSDRKAQEVNKELSDALENMLKPSLRKLISLRDASYSAKLSAQGTSLAYIYVSVRANNLKQAAENWKKKTEAARGRVDAAKVKGEEALGIHKVFASDVSSVMSDLTSAIRKIDALKTPAGEIKEEIEGRNGERILEQINALVKDAEAVVNALKDAEAETLRDEQTKTALTDIMEEVELNMTDVEKAAAAVTNDITFIGAVIEKVDALKAAADKARDLWNGAEPELDGQFDKAEDAITAVTTTITATESAVESFGKSSDPKAQEVKEELSDIIENMLKPSLKKLMRLEDELHNVNDASLMVGVEYDALKIAANNLKQAAEEWKNETASAEDVEEARGRVDAAKVKGGEALGIQKTFTSDVSSVMSSLTSAIRKIDASKTPAGEIKEEIEGRNGERILEQINALVKDAEAAVDALKDAEAETLRDEQTKTALTDIMGKVELNMTDVAKAVAAMTNDITFIGAVIENAAALETAAKEASGLWGDAVQELDGQLSKAREAVTVVTTTITAMEIAAESFGKSSDLRAQEVNKELSDALENMLKPSLEKLMFLQDVSNNAMKAARKATREYEALAGKARKLKEAAEDRRQRVEERTRGAEQASQEPQPPSEPHEAEDSVQSPTVPPEKTGDHSAGPHSSGVSPPQEKGDHSAGPHSSGVSPPQEKEDHSATPFCSLALPVFIFCWCVLSGMREPLVVAPW